MVIYLTCTCEHAHTHTHTHAHIRTPGDIERKAAQQLDKTRKEREKERKSMRVNVCAKVYKVGDMWDVHLVHLRQANGALTLTASPCTSPFTRDQRNSHKTCG